MSTGLKVVLWVVGAFAVIIVGVIVAGIFMGKSMMDDAKAGSQFAANATHEDCVAELSKRIQACDGLNCYMQSSMFGATCLGGAKGDGEEFCATVPALDDEAGLKTWRGEFCAAQSLADDKCDFAVGLVAGFCGVPKQEASQDGDLEEASEEPLAEPQPQ